MQSDNLLPLADVESGKIPHLTEQLLQCKDLLGSGKIMACVTLDMAASSFQFVFE